jgi:hypothetical protein
MAHAISRLRGGSPKDGSGENLEISTKQQKSCLIGKLEGKRDSSLEAKSEGCGSSRQQARG